MPLRHHGGITERNRPTLQTNGADDPSSLRLASLRSMYATEYNSDAARVPWRTKGGSRWGEENVMQFKRADEAVEFWLGRVLPSKHNTSAPDMIFGRFSSSPANGK